MTSNAEVLARVSLVRNLIVSRQGRNRPETVRSGEERTELLVLLLQTVTLIDL
jgi:hypothetical protein